MQTTVIIAGNHAAQVGSQESPGSNLTQPSANVDSYNLDGDWGHILLTEVVVNGFIVGHYTFNITLPCQAQFYWGDLPSLVYILAGAIPASRQAGTSMPQGSYTYEEGGMMPVSADILPGRHEAVRVYCQQTLFDKLRGRDNPLSAPVTGYTVLPVGRSLRRDILTLVRGLAASGRDYLSLNQQCLELVAAFWKDTARSARVGSWEAKKDAAVAGLPPFIASHLSTDDLPLLSKESLAARCGLSPYQFHIRFHKVFGLSLADYLLKERMEAARNLLATTRSHLTEIAALTGYSEASSLSRAFRKYFGYPPSSVRA